MPRSPAFSRDDLIQRAMPVFWMRGFEATSMDDLVRATGVSRHGIYAGFDGKQALFASCLQAYSDTVVTPAFGQVEAEGATLQAIVGYFELQIRRAETAGLPGPGCLMANAMAETAIHARDILDLVEAHNGRLRSGFARALGRSLPETSSGELDDLADVLVVFANGLWSMSRIASHAGELRSVVRGLLTLIDKDFTP